MADDKLFTQEEVNQMISERLKRERNTLEAYKAQLAADAAAQAEAQDIRQRFDALIPERAEVIHPRLVDLMVSDFTEAVHSSEYEGKTDAQIFSALFGQKGYFKPAGANVARLFSSGEPGHATAAPAQSADDAVRTAFGLNQKG